MFSRGVLQRRFHWTVYLRISLPEKLNISQLFDAGNGADRTDGPTMHLESAPCKVNELRQRRHAVWAQSKQAESSILFKKDKEISQSLILRR